MPFRIKKIILIIFIFINALNSVAQNQTKVDSLLQILETKITAKEKVDIYNDIAKVYSFKDSVKTIFFANQAIEIAKKSKYPKGIADAYFQIGWTNNIAGNATKAIELFEKVLDVSRNSNYIAGESNAYNGLGTANKNKGNYTEALKFYTKSLDIKKELDDKKGMSVILSNIGKMYEIQGDYQNALQYHKKSLDIAKRLGDKKQISHILNNIGIIYEEQGDYPKALHNYFNALDNSKESNNLRDTAYTFNNIGVVYLYQGNYPKALEYFIKSIKIKEELGDKKWIASSFSNVGLVYMQQKKYKSALEYYNKALIIDKEVENITGISDDYNNIGNIHKELKEYTLALDNYFKSLELAESLDYKISIVSALNNIGNVFIAQKKHEKASTYLKKALSISKKTGNQVQIIETINALGDNLLKSGSYIQSEEYLKQNIELSKKIVFPAGLRDAAQTLSKVQKALGNHKAALESYELYHATYDSLLGEEKSKQISQLQIQYETEKKEQEIKSLAQQAEIQSLELKQANFNKTIFGIASLVLLLIGLVLYLINRQKQLALKQRAQDIEQNLLRVQMNPHFIFNAMTSIQDYMNQGNAKQASLYLVKFSKLIRQVLDNSRSEFISLDQEINMLDNYLSIQNLKRDYPFTFTIEVEDGLDCEEIAIPPMFAQPFIENAIEHGITSIKEGAVITIHFSMEEDHLVLKITDNGSGIEEAMKIKRKDHVSHAIKITEERIDLYRKMRKKKIAFEIQNLSQGTQITFNLPFQYI